MPPAQATLLLTLLLPGSVWALVMSQRSHLHLLHRTHALPPSLQRLRQLVTPDPSLPQPGPHPHLDGGPSQSCRPSPGKEGLVAQEKETHL
jgi:hypothetical protein